jgi:hypothetical protein
MKSNNLLWIIAITASLISLYAIWQTLRLRTDLTNATCRHEQERCEANCDEAFLQDTLEIAIARSSARLNHNQALLTCRVDNLGNPTAIDACQQAENDRFNRQMGQLDARVQTLITVRNACRDSCAAKAAACADNDDQNDLPSKIDVPFTVDCIEGNNAPCYKPVPEICKLIQDICKDCLTSLCPGSDWFFSAEGNVTITLTAAANEKEAGRELAHSSMEKEMIRLQVPDQVKLNEGENLYLRFSGEGVKQGASIHLRGYSK